MSIKINLNKKDKGYSILSVILVIVAVIITISVWAMSGENNASNVDTDTLIVESLLNDSQAIKTEYDKLLAAGNVGSKIVFLPNTASTSAAPNMLDPQTGMQYPKVNSKILKEGIANPRGIWVYSKKFAFRHLDNTNNADNTVFIVGVKDSVCQKINQKLYGPDADVGSSASDASRIVTGATPANPNSSGSNIIFTITDSVLSHAVVGCYSNIITPDDSVFFRILQIN